MPTPNLGADTGSAYLFAFDRPSGQWRLTDTLLPENVAQDDEFGQSLAMDPIRGAWLVIGADQSALSGCDDAGAVYHYTSDPRRP